MQQRDYGMLETGLYSVSEAARLLETSQQRVRGWIAGYPNTRGEPIIHNQVGVQGKRLVMGFLNLMEARFISYFARKGVSVNHIRAIVDEARDFAHHEHPFATNVMFKTDGKKIFGLVTNKVGDPKMYDFQKKNWAMYLVMAQSLQKGVEFNPSGEAAVWYPRRKLAPHVVVDPKKAFGQPVLRDSGVPTAAIYDSFKADGKDAETVAHWYDLPIPLVDEAVRFEEAIRQKT